MSPHRPPDPPPVVSAASAGALELSSLIALLAELTASDLGRSRALGLTPLCEEAGLLASRDRYLEARRLLDGRPPLVGGFEEPLGELLERLETGHPPLGGPELVRLAGLLRATHEAAARIREADPPCPRLHELAEGLPDLEGLRREVERALDRRGEVREDATPELSALRGQIRRVRDRLYTDLSAIVQREREHLGEETVPMRGGRLMLVLSAGSRGRVDGLVHGRSATGKSFYFEPLEVVEGNNALQQAIEDEEAERQRILKELVGRARAELPALQLHGGLLGELDLLQAQVRFASLCDAELAELAPRGELRLVAACHPLLDSRLSDLRRRALGQPGHATPIVPLDLELGAETRALVVTGPNAGGKTVALKTLGLLSLASQCGLPVPAAAGTRIPFFRRVVATVGDEQDLLADRSTFSGRLLRLKEAWEGADADSLVLLDELGSGTDPEEGSALAVALLEGLLARRCLALVTTHLTQLAAAALELPGASCAAMEFAPATGRPTFHLLPGPPGGSEALALARRLDLPAEWLDRAESLLGSEHRQLRRLIEEVERLRGELTAARDEATRRATEAARLTARLEEDRVALESERKAVATRLKRELEEFRSATARRLRGEVERLRGELEAGRRHGLEAEAVARLFSQAPALPAAEAAAGGPLAVGRLVRHRRLGWQGTLEKLEAGRAEVRVRGKRLRCSGDELEPSAPAIAAAARRSPASGRGPDLAEGPSAPPEINLVGQHVEPALEALDAYLDRALLSTPGEVRVIHGHGSGRLRQAVREHLRGHRAVSSLRPGEPDEGGNGATVVRLRGA